MGARPSFSPGRSRIQIEGEWTYRRFVEDTGADLNNTGPLSAAATSVTVTDGSLVSSGQTLLIESEQIFIQDVIGNVLTIIRGVNGTSAVTHVDGLDVIVFRYPAEVVQATLLLAGRLWKRKDSPYGPTAGMSPGGKVSVPHSTDVDIATLLSPLRRLPLGVAV
jgi:hypothetical protein